MLLGFCREENDPKRNSLKRDPTMQRKDNIYTFLKSEFRDFISCFLKEIIPEMGFISLFRKDRSSVVLVYGQGNGTCGK